MARSLAVFVIQELLERFVFDEDHHVFEEVAFTICRELCDSEKLQSGEEAGDGYISEMYPMAFVYEVGAKVVAV